MPDIISRKDAIEQGLTTYSTGAPCKHGHISPRKVANGCCTECARLVTKRWREFGKQQEMTVPGVMPSVDYLKSCFNLRDGVLYWSSRHESHFASRLGYSIFLGTFSGRPAGHTNKRNKYIEVRLDGKLFKAHRLIYKIVTGIEPEFIVDHIDGDVSNNNPNNLREATSQQNARNSVKRVRDGSSKFKGVYYKENVGWYSVVTVDDVAVSIKAKSEIEAARDYDRRAIEQFGEFASLNFNIKEHK